MNFSYKAQISASLFAFSLFPLIAMAQEKPASDQTEAVTVCTTCIDVMSPTQIANGFWNEMRSQSGDYDQVAIVGSYIQLLTMDHQNMPESRLDRLALGEGAFLTFQVEPAATYFGSLLEGDDLVSEHAWQRMMQITYRAYDETEKTRKMLQEYEGKFAANERNTWRRYQQSNNFISQYIKDENPDEAMAFLIDEIRSLPTDAPYASYQLLGRYSEAIAASPKAGEVRKLVKKKLSGLKRQQSKWRKDTVLASNDPILRGDMPIWYWRVQKIEAGESLRAGRKRQLDALINGMEKWLEG